jgi:hypothetical protein
MGHLISSFFFSFSETQMLLHDCALHSEFAAPIPFVVGDPKILYIQVSAALQYAV